MQNIYFGRSTALSPFPKINFLRVLGVTKRFSKSNTEPSPCSKIEKVSFYSIYAKGSWRENFGNLRRESRITPRRETNLSGGAMRTNYPRKVRTWKHNNRKGTIIIVGLCPFEK